MSDPLDLTSLKCPLPALLAHRALSRLEPGSEITVIADDPMAAIDIPHMCRQENFTVVAQIRDGVLVRFILRR